MEVKRIPLGDIYKSLEKSESLQSILKEENSDLIVISHDQNHKKIELAIYNEN
jgi:hypothetical protein